MSSNFFCYYSFRNLCIWHFSPDWAPKVQMKSRRRENMSKEVRTTRGASTHWDGGTDLMGAHQGQLDWEWWSMWSNWTLSGWQWRLTEKPRTMALGFDSTAWTDFVGAWIVWMLTFIDLDGGGRTLDFPWVREPWLLLGLERKGEEERGREKGGGNF